MPQIEQVKEEENLRWKKAGQEEVDDLWNEVPAGMENPSFEQVVNKRKREKRKELSWEEETSPSGFKKR